MHNGLRLALIVALTVLFSLYLLNEHLRDLRDRYRLRPYAQGWLHQHWPGPFQGDKDGLYHQA
ncbi:hypothetical protein BJX76DRAFT_321045 [Aspergillus varians]